MKDKNLVFLKFANTSIVGYYDESTAIVEDPCYVETGMLPSGQTGISLNPVSTFSGTTSIKINQSLLEFSCNAGEIVKENFIQFWSAICNNPAILANCPCANPPSALALPPVKKLFL